MINGCIKNFLFNRKRCNRWICNEQTPNHPFGLALPSVSDSTSGPVLSLGGNDDNSGRPDDSRNSHGRQQNLRRNRSSLKSESEPANNVSFSWNGLNQVSDLNL